MDLLAQGAVWLEATRAAFAASDVLYVRGASSLTVKATKGKSLFESVDASGTMLRTQTADWLITASTLLLDDVQTTPAVGDVIIETRRDGSRHSYDVVPPNGETPWRWSDGQNITFRIHTKHAGAVAS